MLLTVHAPFVVYTSHLLEVHGTGSHHCRVANSRCNAGVHAIAQLGYKSTACNTAHAVRQDAISLISKQLYCTAAYYLAMCVVFTHT